MADIRYEYDIMYGFLTICLVATIIGLLLKRKWGYTFAVTANAALAAISFGILCVSLILVLPELDILQILKINLINMIAGLISLGFFIWLMKSKKEYQNKCRL